MGLIESVKETAVLVQQIGNRELYEKLVSLQSEAMTLADENWKLKAEIRDLKDEIRDHRERQTIQNSLSFEENSYFTIRDGARDGPYCQVCWDVDKKLVRHVTGSYGLSYCNYCTRHRKK